MNSNPRLVTVGGTITSQIHDVRATIAKAIFIANIILHSFPTANVAYYVYARSRCSLFFILSEHFFFCVRTRDTPDVQFARFVLRRRINRVRVISARFNSTVNQTDNLTILRSLPAISTESSSDFYWNFTLRLLQMATSRAPRHAAPWFGGCTKETRPNN